MVSDEIKRLRHQSGWCWLKGDPESTYPDARELLADGHWPPTTGIHEVEWGVPGGTTYTVLYYDKDGTLETKEFDSMEEAEAFKATVHMSPPDDKE